MSGEYVSYLGRAGTAIKATRASLTSTDPFAGTTDPREVVRPKPKGAPGKDDEQFEARNGSIGVDVDGIHHAMGLLDQLHEKASKVRKVRIDVAHNFDGDHAPAPPSMRHRLNGGYASDGRNWG